MPLIFFVSGAAAKMSGAKRNLWETALNRAKRVLLPYYRYIIYSFIIFVILEYLLNEIGSYNYKLVNINYFPHALVPSDGALGLPFAWHLWFIIPYLLVCCIFVFEKQLIDRYSRFIVSRDIRLMTSNEL